MLVFTLFIHLILLFGVAIQSNLAANFGACFFSFGHEIEQSLFLRVIE